VYVVPFISILATVPVNQEENSPQVLGTQVAVLVFPNFQVAELSPLGAVVCIAPALLTLN
jgi:hypothetical protein